MIEEIDENGMRECGTVESLVDGRVSASYTPQIAGQRQMEERSSVRACGLLLCMFLRCYSLSICPRPASCSTCLAPIQYAAG